MNNEEMLKKAIKKAMKNGYLLSKFDFDMDWKFHSWIEEVNDIIFDHDFAKAFWGEEEICCDCGEVFEPDDNDGLMCKHCIENAGYDDNLGDSDTKYAWQYHLQQMVLEKYPIKYLEKFV